MSPSPHLIPRLSLRPNSSRHPPSTMLDFVPGTDAKRNKLRISQLALPIAFLIFVSAFALHNVSKSYNTLPSLVHGPPLTFLTLLFGETNNMIDSEMVTHNCLLISRTRHKYIIYTENRTHPFCHVCQCQQFVPTNCHLSCADPEAHACNHCEKLRFVRDSIESLGQFVFLDSDLAIVKDSFMDRLSPRTLAHDFLATYGFRGSALEEAHLASLNSGLFFIRRLPHLNYSTLIDLMYTMDTNSDQSVISSFVYKHYKNWDSLSKRWNCRLSYVRRTNYPLEECYTFHGRAPIDKLFDSVGKKILRLPEASQHQ